jgi:hypothetical protein
MFLEVTKATYLRDYKILLHFNNGISKIVDLENELDGAIFEPLKDKSNFMSFSIKYNTIEWGNGADFAPEYLFQIGTEP